jgi:hypothetical protein
MGIIKTKIEESLIARETAIWQADEYIKENIVITKDL